MRYTFGCLEGHFQKDRPQEKRPVLNINCSLVKGSRLNEKEKVSQDPAAFISLQLLPVGTVPATASGACCHDFLATVDCPLKLQANRSPPFLK